MFLFCFLLSLPLFSSSFEITNKTLTASVFMKSTLDSRPIIKLNIFFSGGPSALARGCSVNEETLGKRGV